MRAGSLTRSRPSRSASSAPREAATALQRTVARAVDLEAPDGRAEEGEEAVARPPEALRGAARSRRRPHAPRLRVLLRDRVRARDEHFLAHVERDEATQRSLGDERVQEEARLLRGPRAELDQRRPPASRTRSRAPAPRGSVVGAGEVVLGEPGDLVEEERAALVVEPDRGDLLRRVSRRPAQRRLVERRPALGARPRTDVDPYAQRPVASTRLGAAEAGEDVAAVREVPAPEARPGDQRVGRPRAAAEDAVLVAEEDLRELRVREGEEARDRGRSGTSVHSQTSPVSWRQPTGLSPPTYEPAGAGEKRRWPRFAS